MLFRNCWLANYAASLMWNDSPHGGVGGFTGDFGDLCWLLSPNIGGSDESGPPLTG